MTSISIDSFKTPTKRVKRNSYASTSSNGPDFTEMCKIYVKFREGTKVATLAKDLGRSASTIRESLSKAYERKDFNRQDSSKGRKRKLNDDHKRILQGYVLRGEVNSAHQAWKRISNVSNVKQISYKLVNEYYHTIGSFVTPLLKTKISEANKVKRVEYAKKYLNFNFSRTLFTDESRFELNANTLKVFKFTGQPRPVKEKFNPNLSVMVWGGVSCVGKTSIHVIEGRLDGTGYKKLMMKHKKSILKMFGGKEWYFVQDNAPCHKANVSVAYIEKHLTKNILPHPPQSPDFNPIELIWALMKRLVEGYKPRTKRELEKALYNAWDKVKSQFIKNCVGNLRKKMMKVIEKEGELQ